MKQFKKVIITFVVLIVFAVGALLAIKLIPENTGGGEKLPGAPGSETVKIIDRKTSEISSVKFSLQDGESFAIDCTSDKNGIISAKIRGDDGTIPYNDGKLSTTLSYLALLGADEEVGEDDGAFGFDAPRLTVELRFIDGEVITLLVGSDTPVGDGVYVRRRDSAAVYTVGESTRNILFMKRQDYIEFGLFSEISDTSLITSVTLSRPGKTTLKVVEKTDEEKKLSSAYSSAYKIISPVEAEAHADFIFSELLDKISAIKAASLCEDNPKNLEKYGLSNPVKLSFTLREEEETVSLLIGKNAEDGGTYVMREGSNLIVLTEKTIDFLDISHTEIINQLIWLHNSDEISEISYELGGKTHTLKLNLENGKLSGEYDGVLLEGKNATNLFLHTVRFSIAGEYNGAPYKSPAIKIAMKLNDGKTTTLELCEINERHYAAKVDGKAPQFYVNVTEVRELINCFDILGNGGTLPSIV